MFFLTQLPLHPLYTILYKLVSFYLLYLQMSLYVDDFNKEKQEKERSMSEIKKLKREIDFLNTQLNQAEDCTDYIQTEVS